MSNNEQVTSIQALADTWQTRIDSDVQLVDPRSLIPNEKNFRVHPMPQRSALVGSLEDIGWIDVVKVNKNTGHIVDGHLRVEQAIQNGQETVPVIFLDLTEEEEAKALLLLDPISAMAKTDFDKLEQVLGSIYTANENVMEFFTTLANNNGLDVAAPDFKEFDESVADEVEMITCPHCGKNFPK